MAIDGVRYRRQIYPPRHRLDRGKIELSHRIWWKETTHVKKVPVICDLGDLNDAGYRVNGRLMIPRDAILREIYIDAKSKSASVIN